MYTTHQVQITILADTKKSHWTTNKGIMSYIEKEMVKVFMTKETSKS